MPVEANRSTALLLGLLLGVKHALDAVDQQHIKKRIQNIQTFLSIIRFTILISRDGMRGYERGIGFNHT